MLTDGLTIGVYNGCKTYKQRCEETILAYLKDTGKRLHWMDCNHLWKIVGLKAVIESLREQGNEIESELITTIGMDGKERYHTEYWIKNNPYE